jgi:hypothetical protein
MAEYMIRMADERGYQGLVELGTRRVRCVSLLTLGVPGLLGQAEGGVLDRPSVAPPPQNAR